MHAIYVYAIIFAQDALDFDMAGTEPGHGETSVYVITHRDLAAVVSASPIVDYRTLKREEVVRHLVVHERVIETIMQTIPVLPVKFGTVLPDEDRVCTLLEQGGMLFRPALERIADQVQVEVVLLWDPGEIFEQIGQEEAIQQLKKHLTLHPSEDMMSGKIALGQMVHASLEKHRAALRDHLLLELQGLALDWVINAPMDDRMAVNVALLIHETAYKELVCRLNLLDEEFEGRFQLRCIGPLPPYSFATVEVQVPSFERIDQARRLLGLKETTTQGEIKRAFRQMASGIHPDHNLADPEAESRMAALNQAYGSLMIYAEDQIARQAAVLSGDTAKESYSGAAHSISLSQHSVERAFSISLQKQETPI